MMGSGRTRFARFKSVVTAVAFGLVSMTSGAGTADAWESRVAPDPTIVTTITPVEWAQYRTRFVDQSGRVIDIEKNAVSHSEGQGYGLLLAVRADDRATFDQILRFTTENMRARSDGLISWIYNPQAYPRITDGNNATDGDILIAYALVTAAVKWDDARYIAVAYPMIDAIGRLLLERRDGLVRLRPAAYGFDENHPDGPVVNLSYYIYGAFLLFSAVDDRYPWIEAWQSGLQLTAAATAGREKLVPDWITMRHDRYLAPAEGFARKSSYDAVRIPLYMALGGRVPAEYIAPFDNAWNIRGRGMPKDYDLTADREIMDMNEPGYRAIAALSACAARGMPIPPALRTFHVRRYFSSSLHLLALSAVRSNYPHCIDDGRTRVAFAGGEGYPQGVALEGVAGGN